MRIYNFYAARRRAAGIKRIDYCAKLLIDDMTDWPEFRPEGVVVFGAGEVSGILARNVAEMVADGKLADNATIYFTGGGVSPYQKAVKQGTRDLIDRLAGAGISPPKSAESEAVWMERVFRRELAKELKKRGLSAPPTRFAVRTSDEKEDTNTQTNVRMAANMGADAHGSLMLVSLPYHARRAMGTWRHEMGRKAVLAPLLSWPHELDIDETNWDKNLLARYMLLTEGKKYVLPSPETAPYVVKDKFADPVDVAHERSRAQALGINQKMLHRHPKP